MEYIWRWYSELQRGRYWTFHGVSLTKSERGGFGLKTQLRLLPLTYEEILAWAVLTKRFPTRQDVLLLFRVNDAIVAVLEGRDLPEAKPQTVAKEFKNALRMLAGKGKRRIPKRIGPRKGVGDKNG